MFNPSKQLKTDDKKVGLKYQVADMKSCNGRLLNTALNCLYELRSMSLNKLHGKIRIEGVRHCLSI